MTDISQQQNVTATEQPRPSVIRQALKLLNRSGLLLLLIILFIILVATAPNFLTSRNLSNVVRQVSFVGIIACGMTMAMIAADVDLSVGSMVAFASALLGVLSINLGLPIFVAVALVLIIGTLIGAVAGFIRVH